MTNHKLSKIRNLIALKRSPALINKACTHRINNGTTTIIHSFFFPLTKKSESINQEGSFLANLRPLSKYVGIQTSYGSQQFL